MIINVNVEEFRLGLRHYCVRDQKKNQVKVKTKIKKRENNPKENVKYNNVFWCNCVNWQHCVRERQMQ